MDATSFGKYQLQKLLGRGGMGEVYQAYDTKTDRIVALKLLPPHMAEDGTFQQRFRRESQAAAGINDPHVVPIHGFGEIDGIPTPVSAATARRMAADAHIIPVVLGGVVVFLGLDVLWACIAIVTGVLAALDIPAFRSLAYACRRDELVATGRRAACEKAMARLEVSDAVVIPMRCSLALIPKSRLARSQHGAARATGRRCARTSRGRRVRVSFARRSPARRDRGRAPFASPRKAAGNPFARTRRRPAGIA